MLLEMGLRVIAPDCLGYGKTVSVVDADAYRSIY